MPNRKTTNIVLNRVRTIGKYPLIFDILCNQKFVRIYHMKPGEGVFAGSKLSNGETVLGAFTPFVNLIELAPKSIYYSVKSFNGYSSEKIKQEQQTLGRFILATNQLDTIILDNPTVLQQYKEQSTVESGFKFIKNNAFELDSFYLKTPARIGALMMI